MATNLSNSRSVEQIIIAENSPTGTAINGVIPGKAGYVIALTFIAARVGANSFFNLSVGTKIVFSAFVTSTPIQYGPFYPPIFLTSAGEPLAFSLAGGGTNNLLTIYALYVPVEEVRRILNT